METLADQRPGLTRPILTIEGTRSWRRRLLELGFVPGTPATVVRRSPVQGLLEVDLLGSRLSLRIEEARRIAVGEPRG